MEDMLRTPKGRALTLIRRADSLASCLTTLGLPSNVPPHIADARIRALKLRRILQGKDQNNGRWYKTLSEADEEATKQAESPRPDWNDAPNL